MMRPAARRIAPLQRSALASSTCVLGSRAPRLLANTTASAPPRAVTITRHLTATLMAAPPQQSIQLYYWATPNGHKITIALEELGLPYTIIPIDISAGQQFSPDFLKVSPNNKIPAILDPTGPEGQAISVFESGAILQYLARKTSKLYGADERTRIKVDEWLFWQMAGLGPMTGQYNHFNRYAIKLVDDPTKLAYSKERYSKEVDRLLGVLDKALQGQDYIAGKELTIADVASWPWVQFLPTADKPLAPYPNVVAWVDRIRTRPAVQRAMNAGKEHTVDVANLTPEQRASMMKNLFGITPK